MLPYLKDDVSVLFYVGLFCVQGDPGAVGPPGHVGEPGIGITGPKVI